jgi:hypothetical protein
MLLKDRRVAFGQHGGFGRQGGKPREGRQSRTETSQSRIRQASWGSHAHGLRARSAAKLEGVEGAKAFLADPGEKPLRRRKPKRASARTLSNPQREGYGFSRGVKP